MELKKNINGIDCLVDINDYGNVILKVYSNDLVYFDSLPVGRKVIGNLNWSDGILENDMYIYISYTNINDIDINKIDDIFGDMVKYIKNNKIIIEEKSVEDLSEKILQKKNTLINVLLVNGYEEVEDIKVKEMLIEDVEYK